MHMQQMVSSITLSKVPLSSTLLASAIDAVGACIAIMTGPELRFTMVNHAYQAIHPDTQMLGRRFRDVFPTAAAHGMEQKFLDVLESGTPWHIQHYNVPISSDPKALWEGEAARIESDDQDAPASIVVFVRNVTERIQMEQALAYSEEALRRAHQKLQKTIDSITDGLLVLDKSWRYTFVSERAAQIVDMRADELIGGCVWDLFAHAPTKRFYEECHHAVASGQPVHFEEYHPAPLDKWLECHFYPSDDELTVYFRDVTEQRRTDEALRQNAAMLRAISDTSSDAIFAKDRKSRLQFANPATLSIIGKPLNQVLGHTDEELLIDKEAARIMMDNDRRIMNSGRPEELEEAMTLISGVKRTWLTRKAPLRDDDGNVIGIFGIARDITDRKHAEDMIRESDRRKSEFLAVLSHELRNPLAPIRNGLELLELSAPGSSTAKRAMEILHRQSAHLNRLVDDLLDVTRISRGKIELQCSLTDLRDVLHKTAIDFYPMLNKAEVHLHVEQEEQPVWLYADETRINQIIGNLLHNAIKFTPAGGTITVFLKTHKSSVELHVRDTGVGMEPATITEMFEPFIQSQQSLARSKGGLGLGLALAKGLVEMHGGSITASSNGLGCGSEFTLCLPLGQPAVVTETLCTHRKSSAGRKILIVEDNIDAAYTLADFLKYHGHDVHIANDGCSGVAMAKSIAPDIVVCDIGLPDIDGYAVARAMRSDPVLSQIRLIAVSGYAQPEDRNRSIDAGFDEHMAKPANANRLLDMLAAPVLIS
jgi:PAS domain S-box-containing protein